MQVNVIMLEILEWIGVSGDSAKFTQFVNASVETIDHHSMFKKLQSLALIHRLADSYCSLVSDQLLRGALNPSNDTFICHF